ncbi:putative aminopeptidase [Candidatus Desulfosporosinus infrequens]|uniref:Putative aminopeptidase n=1 Tax=Candidatus Desulfosporosinus infrequens TaxID=2043169 RepID=A0A2U3KB36_9FIRM|nr:putative aminopeptidase [Candidatus Desulfosporosinus infrequens]
MPTRRGFLKCLGGLGACLLPWSSWSDSFVNNSLTAQASFKNLLPAKLAMLNSYQDTIASYLKRTAMDDISTLTQQAFEGRRAGSLGEEKTAAYLVDQMRGLGLNPLGDAMENQQRNYSHAFTIYPVIEGFSNGRLTFLQGDPDTLRTPSANIIGGLLGTSTNESIILSAHYDHLGIFQGKLYPGANDNASGVGCILDVMRRLLREGLKPKRNVVLAFWSAEEMGFVGSYSFVQNPTILRSGIQAVFNVDTVGNGPVGEFAFWANNNNRAVQAVQTAVAKNKANVVLIPTNGHNSDQLYFNIERIPAVTLMSRDWLNKNHTPEDVPSFVDPQKIALASDILYGAVHELAF